MLKELDYKLTIYYLDGTEQYMPFFKTEEEALFHMRHINMKDNCIHSIVLGNNREAIAGRGRIFRGNILSV